MPKPGAPKKPDDEENEDDAFVKSAPDPDLLNDEDDDPMEDTDLEIDAEEEDAY
jgi:hypothetical protein